MSSASRHPRAASGHRSSRAPRPSPDPRHVLGREGERHAREHLERLGFAILDANFRTRHGELDLVAFDGCTLVFVEVKTRRAGGGSPWWNLHHAKRGQVRAMARAWLAATPARPRASELRFDAIGVAIDPQERLSALEHLEGAF